MTLDRSISVDSFLISSGNFSAADNSLNIATRFEAAGGISTFGEGASLSTPLLKISAGTVNFNEDIVLPPTELNGTVFGGSLGGSGDITITGDFAWTGGTMGGTGKTTFYRDHSISKTLSSLIMERNIINSGGILDWSATGVDSYLELRNASTFTNAADATFLVHGELHVEGWRHGAEVEFNNEGVFRQDASAKLIAIEIPFRNSGLVESLAGTMTFYNGYRQTAGTTNLRGVTFKVESGFPYQNVIFDGGSVFGVANIDAPVINSAELSVGAPIGQIHVENTVTLLNGSRLMMEIGGLSKSVQYDFLFARKIDLGGIFDVRFANGFESTINSADSFDIISTGQIPFGSFDNVENDRIRTSDGLGSFRVVLSSTGITLTDFQPVPEPIGILSMLVPAVILLTRRRSR